MWKSSRNSQGQILIPEGTRVGLDLVFGHQKSPERSPRSVGLGSTHAGGGACVWETRGPVMGVVPRTPAPHFPACLPTTPTPHPAPCLILADDQTRLMGSSKPHCFLVCFLCRFQCPQLPEYLKLVFKVPMFGETLALVSVSTPLTFLQSSPPSSLFFHPLSHVPVSAVPSSFSFFPPASPTFPSYWP